MRIWLLILIAGLSAAPFAVAQNPEPSIPQITAEAGVFFTGGSADEIVYAASTGQTKLSELLWPIPLSPGLSAAVHFRWAPWIVTSLKFQTVIPLSTGNMSDNDWNVNGDLYDSDGNLYSKFHSDSTAYLTADWALGLDVRFPFRTDQFRWNLGLGIDYRQLGWEAWNTTQTDTLASDGSSYAFKMTGLSGTFRQSWVLAYLAGEISTFWAGSDWSLDVKISPYPFVSETDAHILRQLTFSEALAGGFMIEPEVSSVWPLVGGLKLKLSLDYLGVFFLRGDEVASYDGATSGTASSGFTSFTGSSGAGLQSFSAGLSLETTF